MEIGIKGKVETVVDGSIDFNHVTFSYKHGSGKSALMDIDLHIRSGETIGIIGGADAPTPILVEDAAAGSTVGSAVDKTGKTADASDEEQLDSLSKRLLESGDFSTAAALAFLVFILLYVPCIATVVAIGTEAGWKWAALSIVYNTAVAWVVAWIVYHIARLFC